MRRDLIIGILASALLHGAVFGSSFIKDKPKPPPPVEEPPTIELMEMPELEIEPEEVIETDEPAEQVDFAPPMQTDVPQLVTVDSFVQPIQPPPPENMKPTTGVISIPTARQTGLGKGIEVFDISKLDQVPMPKFRARPQYPFEMRRAGITGEVVVEFIVDTNGDSRNAFAVRSTQREFEQAAVQAVSKWKFRPGRKGGRAVNTRMQVPIVFTLNDE
ncbi:MAG: TonB family protein [Cephaloticoccus sp.]|nr:TonB family protein [Cephaloticoccus sp.]MCF7760386.1 TonB family protein [Cephaloticoccus sp.]